MYPLERTQVQTAATGPFSSAALAESALRQLREQAEGMAARGCPPAEIAVSLTQTAELWRTRGADLPNDATARVLAEIGCTDIPAGSLTPLIQEIRGVHVLAGWLYGHAAQPLAWLIRDASMALILAQHDGEDLPC